MAQKDKQVNVPRDVEDEFYRYKMPVLRAKVEGRGNGIKTVVENCADIAKALDRNPDYVVKFFGFELGTLTSNHNEKYIVNGKHDAEVMSKVLDLFIDKFVLCGGCRNPETNMNIKGDKIFLICRACGKTTQCDPTHKLVSYMTKRDKPTQKAKQASGKAQGKPKPQDDDEDDEEDWCLATTREAVEERRRETLGVNDRLSAGNDKPDDNTPTESFNLTVGAGQDPVAVLEKYWESNPGEEEALVKVNALATAQAWSEGTLLRNYVFPSLFAKDVRNNFYKKAGYLNLFVKSNKKQQKVVLYCIEKLCQIVPQTIQILPSLLNGFYEEEILDEDILVQWYKHPVTDPKRFDAKVTKAIRDSAKVFIDWVQSAEMEKDED